MSTTIDNQVVEMRFDNKHFENNVQTTLSTLDKLKQSLNLSGASKGLEDVGSAAKGIDLSGLSGAAETVRLKFSALQVMAITALQNITNSAINAGKKIVSALTVDPIKSGFQEYETQINAVQTILANTSSKGKTLKDVNGALDELNAYADKTIYNFTEMTRNIGTFTAAGVDLDTSVQAIKGIANLAAVSGSTSQQASTAMYQLSQALASGTVKLQDWNSVVNAGMGGQVFQDSLKETARLHGVAIDDMIENEGSFRETLKNGWLTSEILTETLSKFTGDLNEEQLKTMGYTDEQIQSIIKMGQTANDAATKVKTFTQLFDTLKEAAQSGWTQSWEIIVGDFEEAKELLTEVSDVFGGIIGASAAARNEMLQGWKDLGGRTALIEAVRNAFEGIMSIITPIKDAFREIFPPITAQQLYAFTEGLKKLTSHLKLSDSQSAKLKSTFKGVFAVLDIVRQAFAAVWNVIKPLFGGVGKLGDGVLGVTASWGDWLVKLNDTIKTTNIFTKALQKVVKFTTSVVTKIKNIFTPVITAVKSFVTSVKEKIETNGLEIFHNVLGRVNTRMEQVGEAAGNMKSGVTTAVTAMWSALANSKILKFFLTLWEAVKVIAGGIAKAIGGMMSGLTEDISEGNFDGLMDVLTGLSIGGVALAISNFLKSLTEPLSGLQGIIDGLTGILDGVRGCFEAYQTNLKADTLTKIATAIGIVAASVLVISLIDSDKLAASLGAITVLFGDLMASMVTLNKASGSASKTTKACGAMISLSISVAILAGAMATVSELDGAGLAKGLAGITALCAVMVASAKTMSNGSDKVVKGTLGLVTFALAIKILASACKDLSVMSWEELGKGLAGVGALLAEVSLFLNTAKFSKKATSNAVGILIISAAIKILASACKDFGAMSWEEIGKGLASIGALLAEFVVFTKLAGNAKKMVSTGTSLVLIAASMKIFASAISDMGSMSWGTIGKGLITMAGALAAVTIAVNLMPKNMLSTGVGLVAVGSALAIISGVLAKAGGMSWEGIAKGMVALGGSLGIIAAGLHLMSGTLAGSAALLIASASILTLAPALMILGAMSWQGIVKGLVTLAGTFAVLGVAGLLLGPVVPAILGLAGAISLIGVGLLAAGVGLAAFSVGLSGFSVGLSALAMSIMASIEIIIAALAAIIVGIISIIPAIVKELGAVIVAICEVLIEAAPPICKAITVVLIELIKALKACLPPLFECLTLLVIELVAFLATCVPILVDGALMMIISILEAIADKIDDVVQAGVDVILAFIQGVCESIPKIIDAAFQIIISLINGLASAIENNNQSLIEAVDNLMNAILTAIGEWFSHIFEKGKEIVGELLGGVKNVWEDAKEVGGNLLEKVKEGISNAISKVKDIGKDIVDGLVEGIKKWIQDVVDVGGDLVDALIDAIKSLLGIHSPSRVFAELGEYTVQGFINGIGDKISGIKNAAINLGKNVVNTVKDFLGIHSPSSVFAELGEFTIQGFINGMGSLITNTIDKAENIVSGAKDAVCNFAGKFKESGKELIGNVVDGFGSKIKSVKEKAGSIASNARTAIGNYASKFKSSAQGLIGNVVTGFGNKLSAVKSKAGSIASNARTAIGNYASKFKSSAQNLIGNVVTGFGNKLSAVKSKAGSIASNARTAIGNYASKFKSSAQNLIGNVVTGFGDKLSSAKNKASSIAKSAKEAISDWKSKFKSVGKDLISGLISGIGSKASKLVKKAEGVVDDAVEAAKNLLGIKSPSRVFAEMGRYVDEGFILGLEKFAGKVSNATRNVGYTAINAMSDAISKASTIVDGDLNVDPVIRPVLDLSEIQNGSKYLNGIFGQQTVTLAGINAGIIGGNTNALSSIAAQMENFNAAGNEEVVSAITSLRGDVAALADAISKMQITMDGGTVVGELITRIDSGLGRIATHKGRGN